MLFVFMGVAGAGKSTFGSMAAKRFGFPFYEGDDYHSDSSIEAMRVGTPLNDELREAWIDQIIKAFDEDHPKHACLSCSALSARIRRRLSAGIGRDITYFWLNAPYRIIERRLNDRKGHYMSADLLRSQYDSLEPPDDAVRISVDRIKDDVMADIEREIHTRI